MQITIQAANAVSFNVTVEAIGASGAPTRIQDVLSEPSVTSVFGKTAAEVVAAFTSLNGNAVASGLRDIVAASAIADGMVLGVSLPAQREVVSASNESARPGSGQPGTVMLYADGGMITVRIGIVNGQHSAYDAIHNGRVKAETRYDDTMLSACSVMINDTPVQEAQLRGWKLWDGDSITLSRSVAHVKG